jgi:GTP-binding protein
LKELTEEIMQRVERRGEQMRQSGEEVTMLREVDPVPESTRRLPPHLAGPTAQLSDDCRAKDYSPQVADSDHEDPS